MRARTRRRIERRFLPLAAVAFLTAGLCVIALDGAPAAPVTQHMVAAEAAGTRTDVHATQWRSPAIQAPHGENADPAVSQLVGVGMLGLGSAVMLHILLMRLDQRIRRSHIRQS